MQSKLALLLALGLVSTVVSASAVGPAIVSEAQNAPPPQFVDNKVCFACHDTPGMQTELPSGEQLYLTVDHITYNTATHGRLGYACVQCHTNISGYPHEPITATTRREFNLQLYTVCARCHKDKYDAALDGVHQKALAGGNQQAAVCTDCHGAHDIGSPHIPFSKVPKTCERCHSQIYARYQESVHGSALIGEGNPDVPTCTDCHGVHNVEGPSTGPFHLFSPQICADCHADPDLMERYGVSTDVFKTYVADFHGTTVILFEKITPDQETNKPVCIDCHGVHDMRQVDDPESTVIKKNLLSTCQKCHPDASINFPASWLSHYVPSPEHASLVYFVNLFYSIFIPGVIGAMAIFVVADGTRRILHRRRERSHE
ncbi:MAG: cytochrome C [Anaerolineales bacterium]|nr:cytochrome C [Anaerolineales bacterium]